MLVNILSSQLYLNAILSIATASDQIPTNPFHGRRLVEGAADDLREEGMQALDMAVDDTWYYDYYSPETGGQTPEQIEACSEAIESLNDRRLCVHWHQDDGLKLGMTENAYATAPSNMLEFNTDSDWNSIDIVDNLGKAAARDSSAHLLFDEDDIDSEHEAEDGGNDENNVDDGSDDKDEWAPEIMDENNGASSKLAFMLGGLVMRKCQSFEGYTLCAKYNPAARQYQMSLTMASGRMQKSEYEQSLHRMEQYAAQTLSDNLLSDEYNYESYDDEYDYNYNATYDEEDDEIEGDSQFADFEFEYNYEDYDDVMRYSQEDHFYEVDYNNYNELNEDGYEERGHLMYESDDYQYGDNDEEYSNGHDNAFVGGYGDYDDAYDYNSDAYAEYDAKWLVP